MAQVSCRQIKDKNIVISLYIKQTKTPELQRTMVVFMFTLFLKIQSDIRIDVGTVYSSLSVWEQQHMWPSAPPAWNFLLSSHTLLSPIPYCIYFCSHTGLDIGLASRPGCSMVGLRSIEPFHYKLLPWSWLKRHWRADWLQWRSLLMCHLIFPPFPWGNEYWIAVAQWTTVIDNWRYSMHTRIPHTPPTVPDA